MNNNNNPKEAIKLLNTGSSNSDSSDPEVQFSIAPPPTIQARRKIRTKRKFKRAGNDTSTSNPLGCTGANILKTAVIVFTVCGGLVLGWIVFSLHSEVQSLADKLSMVPNTNDDQERLEFKRILKELKSNQSHILNSLKNNSQSIELLNKQLTNVTSNVENIYNSLKEAPQMLNIGKELESLKASLASYEAIVNDLRNGHQTGGLDNVGQMIDNLNATVMAKVEWAIEDLHKHHGMISELEDHVRNVTDMMMEHLVQRVDTMQTQLMRMEGQQRNTSLTIRYVLDLLDKYDRDHLS